MRETYDIQQKGIHFLNIIELKYDPEHKTPAGFYNEYRTMIINNVGRAGEVIHWNQNQELDGDETIGPLFEDVILLNVINLIDPRLPQFIKEYYQLKLGERHLMDIRTDIFNNIKKFLSELDTAEQLNSLRTQSLLPTAAATINSPTLAAFSTARSVRS